MLTIIIGLLIIFATACLFIIQNLLKKVEMYEEDILLKDQYIAKLGELVDTSYTKIKELDIKGAFESDDETGVFFESLKEMALNIKTYSQNYTK